LAFEPVPATYTLLSVNVELFPYKNITLLNAAASNATCVSSMSVPQWSNGLKNFYRAQLSPSSEGSVSVFTMPLDSLSIIHPVALVKIDAENHEAHVLEGMSQLLKNHHPILIIETDSQAVISSLSLLGYNHEKLDNSPNFLFRIKSGVP